MSKIYEGLRDLRNLGFNVCDDNKEIVLNTYGAEKLYDTYNMKNRGYVLGSIPSSTESLNSIDFDICFDEVERYASNRYLPGNGAVYLKLHDLARLNNVEDFVSGVGEYSKIVGDENIESALWDLIEDVTKIRDSVLDELNDLIVDLNQHA